MSKQNFEFKFNSPKNLDEVEGIIIFINKNVEIEFLEIKKNKTASFIGDYESIPVKYKSITFSFDSNDDDYESIIKNIQDEIKKWEY